MNMKTKITSLIAALSILTGCVTPQHCDPASPDYEACVAAAKRAEVQLWADDIQDIMAEGVPLILGKNPDLRDEANTLLAELEVLEKSPTASIATLQEMLKRAGVDELESREGSFVITGTRIIIRHWIRRELAVEVPAHVRIIAGGLRRGLEDGLAVLGEAPKD